LALSVAGCRQPVPPPVSARDPALDADDLAVMKGLLDDLRQHRPSVSFLVVDTTIAICGRAIDVVAPPPGGCLAQPAIDAVQMVLPADRRVTATHDFQARNARRLPIAETLAPGVAYVSATVMDFVSVNGEQERARAIVTVSAPSYPAPRVAVLAYRVKDAESGAVRLERQSDGRWLVSERQGRLE
jgi:hypothetical protein